MHPILIPINLRGLSVAKNTPWLCPDSFATVVVFWGVSSESLAGPTPWDSNCAEGMKTMETSG